jgi:galactokinase
MSLDRSRPAVAKAALLSRAAAALPGNAEPAVRWFVPGRVEFLGKHTDYAGGRSLLCTVDRGICLCAAPRPDGTVRIRALGSDDVSAEFPLVPDLPQQPRDWSDYPRTVARRIAQNFAGELRGAEIAIASDLPQAAGLSSSSALVVAIFCALSDINHLEQHPAYQENIHKREDLAGYLGTVENGQSFGTLAGHLGVGTFGGSEDHTAILCGEPHHLMQYSFCPVRFERRIELPADHTLVIASSGVLARKTSEAKELYNQVSLRAKALLEIWRRASERNDATLADAVGRDTENLASIEQVVRTTPHPVFPAQNLLDRLHQFVEESMQIIPLAGDAVARRDWKTLAELVDRSEQLATQNLENQVPQTIELAAAARKLGAIAASGFGAGFGGSVWVLVRRDDAESFKSEWQQAYRRAFPIEAASAVFFETAAGLPATRL